LAAIALIAALLRSWIRHWAQGKCRSGSWSCGRRWSFVIRNCYH